MLSFGVSVCKVCSVVNGVLGVMEVVVVVSVLGEIICVMLLVDIVVV